MKRFWQTAAVASDGAGHGVTLDGKPVRLPGGARLLLPTAALAAAVAAEWQEAAAEFVLDDLPLTRLAGTAQERIAPDPAPVAEALAAYAGSDLLCYRAKQPPELVAQQEALWQPWLDWAARRHGARLLVTAGIVHVPQDNVALAALAAAVAALDVASLAGLGILVPAYGSLVLALAVIDGALDAQEAFDVSTLDESFQARHWGHDAEAASRRALRTAEVAVAARFVRLSRPEAM